MRVAIISPNQNAYSETFIQAHRKIDSSVLYYFGGNIPNQLEGYGYLDKNFFFLQKLFIRAIKTLFKNEYSYAEYVLANSFKKRRVDVVLAEFGTTGASLTNICKKSQIPLVTIFHGADASIRDLIDTYKEKYSELFTYSIRIVAVSKIIALRLQEMGCLKEKIIYTPCAPSDKFIEIIPTFKEKKSFVALGRFVEKKAPYYTILAIKKVSEKHPDVKLYYGGDGVLFSLCEHLIRYFKLERNVILLGKIGPEEFMKILSNVSGLIQHSITASNGDMEGTPVAILEASAAGVPVISTRHSGIIDVIIENETGFLVDEHDVDGMAEKIITLIESPNLALELGKKGKENIKRNFSMQRHLEILENAIQDAYNLRNNKHK